MVGGPVDRRRGHDRRPLEWPLKSVRVAVPTAILALVFSVTGAYASSRFKFRGRGLTAMLILVTQMLPGTPLVRYTYCSSSSASSTRTSASSSPMPLLPCRSLSGYSRATRHAPD